MSGRPLAVLDGGLRTVVQAGQTHHAPLRDPDRRAVAQRDGGDGTALRAETAADAGVGHREMRGAPHLRVVRVIEPDGEHRHLAAHEVAAVAALDVADQRVDLRLGGALDAPDLRRVAQIEHRRPGVGHLHAEAGVQRQPLSLQMRGDETAGLPGGRAIGGGEPEIGGLGEPERVQELVHDRRQAPEVDGGEDADGLILGGREREVLRPPARGDGAARLPGDGGHAVGDILAVAGGGKVEDHSRPLTRRRAGPSIGRFHRTRRRWR